MSLMLGKDTSELLSKAKHIKQRPKGRKGRKGRKHGKHSKQELRLVHN